MKLISNNQKLVLFMNTDGTPVSIRKAVTKDTDLSKPQTQWNLSNLVNIVTFDTLKNDQERINAKYKRDIATNMMLGAVTGGFLDGMSGDDSIVDGVLIGTAFGAITTSANKREAVAHVGLIFADDESIAVEVNKQDYSILQMHCIQNLKKINKGELPPTKEQVRYNEKERETVGVKRQTSSLLKIVFMLIWLSMSGLATKLMLSNTSIYTNGFSASQVHSSPDDSMLEENTTDNSEVISADAKSENSLDNTFTNLSSSLMPFMGVILALLSALLIIQVMFVAAKEPKDFIKPNEKS